MSTLDAHISGGLNYGRTAFWIKDTGKAFAAFLW